MFIWLFHDGIIGIILSSGDIFSLTSGVKQGCFLAAVLFNLFFAYILNYALHDSTCRVYLRYRLNCSPYDPRWLNARTRTQERLIMEDLFADDHTLMAHLEHTFQTIISRFAKAFCLFGLTISLSKTEVMYQPVAGSTASSPGIYMGGSELKSVNHFKYLGSVISLDGTLDREIET